MFTVRVWDNLTIPGDRLPQGVVGHAYREPIMAYGGMPPYHWRLVDGILPLGLTFDSDMGEVIGTPLETTTSIEVLRIFTVEVSDASTPPQSYSRSIYIPVFPTVRIATNHFEWSVKDESFSRNLRVDWGKPPYTVGITSGALPPGLTLRKNVVDAAEGSFPISGTPSQLGVFPFTVTATDSSIPPDTTSRDLSIRVNEKLVITTTSLPPGFVGDPYDATLQVKGGAAPYEWFQTPPLPQGLTLGHMTGKFTGTPTESFIGSQFIHVRDTYQSAGATLSMTIVGRLKIATSRMPRARPNIPYRARLGVAGGAAPYVWSIVSGMLPLGLNLNPTTGDITGIATSEGTRDFTVRVSNATPIPQETTRALSLTIASDLGRNDSPATATPISNGTLRASISPFADPVAGPANPDNDYYELTASSRCRCNHRDDAQTAHPHKPPRYRDRNCGCQWQSPFDVRQLLVLVFRPELPQ